AEEWADLTHFEGNANALRILTHAFAGKDKKGFALTYATLASIVKYPCSAIDGHQKGNHHRKKYGYFDTEIATFQKIAEEDRKSTRLNSSHVKISYAVFCL